MLSDNCHVTSSIQALVSGLNLKLTVFRFQACSGKSILNKLEAFAASPVKRIVVEEALSDGVFTMLPCQGMRHKFNFERQAARTETGVGCEEEEPQPVFCAARWMGGSRSSLQQRCGPGLLTQSVFCLLCTRMADNWACETATLAVHVVEPSERGGSGFTGQIACWYGWHKRSAVCIIRPSVRGVSRPLVHVFCLSLYGCMENEGCSACVLFMWCNDGASCWSLC